MDAGTGKPGDPEQPRGKRAQVLTWGAIGGVVVAALPMVPWAWGLFQSHNASQAQLAGFARQIDSILPTAKTGRSHLVNAVDAVEGCHVWPGRAAANVARIEADDRKALQNQIADVSRPNDPDAQTALLDLKAAVRYSIQADASYISWLKSIEPQYERIKRAGCLALPHGMPDYQSFLAASGRATAYKRQFVHVFDRLAASYSVKDDWRAGNI
jgi:hypothetical protein